MQVLDEWDAAARSVNPARVGLVVMLHLLCFRYYISPRQDCSVQGCLICVHVDSRTRHQKWHTSGTAALLSYCAISLLTSTTIELIMPHPCCCRSTTCPLLLAS